MVEDSSHWLVFPGGKDAATMLPAPVVFLLH